ncbi:MAG: RNA polymerase sigma factor SigZ [Holophagales bacterium]|nr:RNA polymerase sigma factor SigZ [Holophagales bacterium]
MSAEAVWSEFSGRLRAFIASRVRDPADADDLLQEVFLRVHRSGGTLDRTDRLPAWLYQVTRNALTDHYRSRDVRVRHAGGSLDEAAEPVVPEDEARDERELAACLSPMLDQLPAAHREAVALTTFEGLSQVEAAKRLGISISGMKSRTQRGRARIRDLLLRCCEIEVDRRGGVAAFRSRKGTCNGSGGVPAVVRRRRLRVHPPESRHRARDL